MARITVNDVEALYKPRPDQDLRVAIASAQHFVDAVLVPKNELTADQLADVQAAWAAGDASVVNPPVSSGSGRNRTVQYEGTGQNRYYELAARLDTTGTIKKLLSQNGLPTKASITFINSAAEVA
ncbi:hypothetical protein LCGC14_1689310 [marine sediment metagenome]|uniref:Uncharacterized protein n=1 Tax=marine sediment metagenome TaxID=412755 RepID=A0A0F9HLS1_9ZZZZ